MDGTRYILAGSLIDGSGAAVRRQVFLALEDGVIAAIGPAAGLPRDEGAVVDDFSHCTILPALVDCSVSLARSPSVDGAVRSATEEADLARKAALLERHIGDCHAHGVLGVADGDDLGDLAARMALGSVIDIRTARGLCRGGQEWAAAGYFLKIGFSGDIEEEGAPSHPFDRDDLNRLLQGRGGRKAVAVANGERPVAEALAAGCDAVEQGYGMGEENLKAMAERDVLWIPSLLRARNGLDGARSGGSVCCRFSQRYVAPGKPVPGAEAFWKKTLADQLAQLRLARELGVKTALGTGAGSMGILHGEAMVEEMKLFIKAGWSLEETVRSASEHGARFFGMEKLGMLAVGRRANFLIARGTPKQLPRKLSYLEGIYVDGAPSPAYRKNPVRT